MVDAIADAKSNCQMIEADWDSIDQMSKTWHTPLTFAYHEGTEINMNGKNIYQQVTKAISDYDKQNFYDCGIQLGIASAKILLGKQEYMARLNGG